VSYLKEGIEARALSGELLGGGIPVRQEGEAVYAELNMDSGVWLASENSREIKCFKNGAGNRIRTYDPRITNALLYQLSYPGAGRDSIDYATRRHPTVHLGVHGFVISFFFAGG
jgi:hypothetical protein